MNNIKVAIKLKSNLDSLRPLSKEDELKIMQKFRLDWNYHSNHLEGNSLTYGETKALILFGITAQGKPLKDHFEMSGHDDAVKWVMDVLTQDRPLTENFIRELHKLILKESYEVDAITPDGSPTKKTIEIGKYKSIPNHVKTKTGEIFRFSSPEETPSLMSDLIDWYRDSISRKNFNPILVAAEFHYKFIRIHPFDDGNGRTVRILMNFILMQFGYPPVIIKSEDRVNYFGVLQQADAGQIEPFVDYIAKNLVSSLEIMIKGAKGESIEEPDDIDKEISLLENKLNSISQPIKTSRNKESILNIYDNSFKKLLEKFISKSELFEKFYFDNELLLFVNGGASRIERGLVFSKNRIKIEDNTNSIQITFNYNTFKHSGFEEFNFTSSINLKFNLTKYRVYSSDKKATIEKLYDEQLTDEEIDSLVNTEIKRHKNQIEIKIEEVKFKN